MRKTDDTTPKAYQAGIMPIAKPLNTAHYQAMKKEFGDNITWTRDKNGVELVYILLK